MEKAKKSTKLPEKINFVVKVPEVKRELKMTNVDVNLLVRQLEIQICEKIGVDPIDTTLAITKDREEEPLEHAATLKRVVQTTTAGRNAKVQLTRFVPELEIHQKVGSSFKYSPIGLILEGFCQNPTCVKFGKELLIPMGCGPFIFKKIMKLSRCPCCPYKDRGLDPEIKVSALRFSHCYWRYDGEYLDHNNFLRYDYAKDWYKVDDEENEEFYKLIESRRWVDMNIYVRAI
eukprot:TRINITY_DN8166_c0_g1_i3.p1 TRINITY_DN8166_c0_g1~~TRINITY_DN8166_c0_g1_i3.p1  ORF type:complete len:232 (-),score=32.07 TRINITY_DN8166_c0_g1_i3:84-779(-)